MNSGLAEKLCRSMACKLRLPDRNWPLPGDVSDAAHSFSRKGGFPAQVFSFLNRDRSSELRTRLLRRELRERMSQLIGGLGQSERQVALSLRGYGARGVPRDGRGCVLARYLNAVVGADPEVRSLTVLVDCLSIGLARRCRPAVVVLLPEPLSRFVAGFDDYAYPELISTTKGDLGSMSNRSHQPLAIVWWP